MKKAKIDTTANLLQLMDNTENELRRLCYSDSSIRHFREIWDRYCKWSANPCLEKSDWDRFWQEKYGILLNCAQTLTRYQNHTKRAYQVLLQYQQDEYLLNWTQVKSDKDIIPPCFWSAVQTFLEDLQARNYSQTTISDYVRIIRRLTKFLTAKEIVAFSETKPEHLSPFIASMTNYHGNSVGRLLSLLRKFFHFLYLREYCEQDLSLFLPRHNRLRCREHLPMVWSRDDIEKILACVNIASPIGKRDYAIILLVAKTGIRISDVRALKFDNLKWGKNQIVLTQFKTSSELVLPLVEDVGQAIISYLRDGRPSSDDPHIFLRHTPPFTAFDLHNHLHEMLNRYIVRAGLEITADRSHGMHTLRHSLASEMLRRNVPLPIISEVLGHKSVDTTSEYLRIDMSQLRQCALTFEG